MTDVKPFLAFQPRPQRAFADALSTVAHEALPSPWSPKSTTPAADAAPPVDLDKLRADAVAAGRAEGLAETESLRAQLRAAVAAVEAKQPKPVVVAELVADAACSVIQAWSGVDRAAAIKPLIDAWTAEALGPTTVRVHPDDVAALGAVDFTVEPDPAMARGDIVLRCATAEIEHHWTQRLTELRERIAALLEAA